MEPFASFKPPVQERMLAPVFGRSIRGIVKSRGIAYLWFMKMFPRLVLGAAAWAVAISGSLAAESAIFPALKGDLVSLQGGKVKKFDEAPLAQTKYFAIYYSAEWCPPCRAFTPDLVTWYRSTKTENPHFELIFVSSDQSEAEMEKYITGDKMPWPALEFSKNRSNRTLTQYSGKGIPCLVFVDAEGKVLSHSYEGATYVGPRKVLKDIDKILKENPASAEEKAAAASAAAKPAGASSFDQFFKKKPAQ
jgi:nucleoredoxin